MTLPEPAEGGLAQTRRALLGAALVVVLGVALYMLVVTRTSREGMALYAEFGRAGQGLGDTSPVKMRGVEVGTVARIELNDGGRALVRLRIDPGVRVPDTVTASIEPESVFGPKFVNLVPGAHEASGPFLAEGQRITRTSDVKDLSDLLGQAHATVAAIDPHEVSVIVSTLAQGLEGQGPRLRGINENLAELVDASRRDPNSIRHLFGDGGRFTGTVRGTDAVRIAAATNAVIPPLTEGGDRLGRISDVLADVSRINAGGLARHGTDLQEGFRSAERAAAVVYGELGFAGGGIRTTNRLLPVWAQTTTAGGPAGKRAVNIQAFIPSSPCELIIGLCPGTPAPTVPGRP